MATRDGSVPFSVQVKGSTKLLARLRAINATTGVILSSGRLEKLLLRRTLDRFLARGANPRAQKSPDGSAWAPPSKVTLERRRGRGGSANRALYVNGTLMQSIAIVRSNLRSKVALSSPSGAGFLIGVKQDSRASRYARMQNNGGWTPQGKRVPARRFLGISKEDVRAVENMMKREMSKVL